MRKRPWHSDKLTVQEGESARTGQFCPKCAMLEAIDHAISVVRLTRTDRIAERGNGVDTGLPRDNWTLTVPEVRVMTLGGAPWPMQKHRGRFPFGTHLYSYVVGSSHDCVSAAVTFSSFMAKDT